MFNNAESHQAMLVPGGNTYFEGARYLSGPVFVDRDPEIFELLRQVGTTRLNDR